MQSFSDWNFLRDGNFEVILIDDNINFANKTLPLKTQKHFVNQEQSLAFPNKMSCGVRILAKAGCPLEGKCGIWSERKEGRAQILSTLIVLTHKSPGTTSKTIFMLTLYLDVNPNQFSNLKKTSQKKKKIFNLEYQHKFSIDTKFCHPKVSLGIPMLHYSIWMTTVKITAWLKSLKKIWINQPSRALWTSIQQDDVGGWNVWQACLLLAQRTFHAHVNFLRQTERGHWRTSDEPTSS